MFAKRESGKCFQHSDPWWRVNIALPGDELSLANVQPGDIIYTRRPKRYQRLTAIAGDTWRHMGVVTAVHGYLWMIEMNPFGFYARPLVAVVDMYDTVAVQRLAPCTNNCGDLLAHRIVSEMNGPVHFHHKRELAAIGVLSTIRLLRRSRWTSRVQQSVAAQVHASKGFFDRAICSTPIARRVAELCGQHRAVLDVRSPKSSGQSEQCREDQIHEALPDDIWRALTPVTSSFWLKKDGATSNAQPAIDLTKMQKGGSTMNFGH